MKTIGAIAASFLVVACFAGCLQTKPTVQSEMPVCGIVNEDFCFAIDQGDRIELTVPVDFSLYDVTLSNKQKAQIYYGTAPEYPSNSVRPALSKSIGNETITIYKEEMDGTRKIDAFYAKKRDKFTMVVHVRSSYKPQKKASLVGFMKSFRKCTSAHRGLIECKAERVFPDIESFL